jgi:hypothetical protein
MDEYICKNSAYSKPCTLQLHENSLEWQCGKKNGKILYSKISTVLLNKQGKKYSIQIESSRDVIIASNRFHLSNTEYEDRSRQYSTFVRMLHLHLSNQKTTSFFSGTSSKVLFLFLGLSFTSCLGFQIVVTYLLGYVNWPMLGITVVVLLLVSVVSFRQRPRPYDGKEIPLDYLPDVNS